MKLVSDVNQTFEIFCQSTSILYSNGSEVIRFSYEDVKGACEIIKFHLLLVDTAKNVNQNCKYIAVCTDINYLYPVCICGILLSGQQFVCMDVSVPFEWNQNLITHLGISIVISTETCSAILLQSFTSLVYVNTFHILGLKLQIWKTGHESNHSKSSMLYAIQTSGSTGKPKIVCVPETCILPNIVQLKEEFEITHEDVILSASPFTFDPSIIELFLAFTSGATLFMVSNDVRAVPNVYLDIIFPVNKDGTAITILQMTPSVFQRWSSEDIKQRILSSESKLKVLALGGEHCPQPEYFMHCQSLTNKTKIYNLYGITEVSCWAMLSKYQDGYLGDVMIDTVAQVQDSDGVIITEGYGELFIGSHSRICVVDNEMELDSNKPVFRPTGDLVHVSNKKYKYLGRKDNVIKRWGQKVSLEEIASCALQCEGIVTSYCILDKKDRLVMFVNNSSKCELKTFLRNKLKAVSMPDIILEIPHFPLTKHGKINNKVLEMMANNHTDLESENINLSRTEYFKILWERYTSKSDDTRLGFLDCGGNSIFALQIVTEMAFKFVRISPDLLTFLLKNRTIEDCCNLFRHFDFEEGNRFTIKHILGEREEVENKKIKYDRDSAICVQCRGQYYGEIVDKNVDIISDRQFTLQKAWDYNLEKCIDASPTLIYYKQSKLSLVSVGSHSGKIAIFELHSGRKMWQITLPDRIESSVYPTEDGKFGIVGCYDGSVYSINLTSGEISWTLNTGAMVKCTPLVAENSVFIGSYNHYVYCIDSKSGKVTWSYKTSASVLSSPLYSNRHKLVLIANLGGSVVALKPDTGKLSWNLTFDNPFFSTPVILSWELEDHLVLAEVNGTLSCISLMDIKQIWSFKTDGNIFSSLTAQNDSKLGFRIMFGCHDHNVYCIQATKTSAELIWKTNIGSPVYATPAVAFHVPYVVVASTKGCVFILNIDNGGLKCNFNFPGEIFSSPIIFESKTVIGCRNNFIYCLAINV